MSHQTTEAAPSRTIRIGASSIGLLGLDSALAKAAAKAMPEPKAVEFLFRQIRRQNYIPPGRSDAYRQALLEEYRRYLGQEHSAGQTLVIRIFGPGCVSCNGLQNLVIQVLDRLGMAADIEQIHDPDEIGRAGILQTPALMFNGEVKSIGLLPTPVMVEQWIREAESPPSPED